MRINKLFILILLMILVGINIASATEYNNITLNHGATSIEINENNFNEDIKLTQDISSNDVNNDSEDNLNIDSLEINKENNILDSNQNSDNESDIIIVNNWDELQYYCSLTDKDYTLKLKENTNFYPTNLMDSNCQIKINNNVKIIGSNGS